MLFQKDLEVDYPDTFTWDMRLEESTELGIKWKTTKTIVFYSPATVTFSKQGAVF